MIREWDPVNAKIRVKKSTTVHGTGSGMMMDQKLEVLLKRSCGARSPGRQSVQKWSDDTAIVDCWKKLGIGQPTSTTPNQYALRGAYRGLLEHLATPYVDIYLGT
jgi:hypothetical protein